MPEAGDSARPQIALVGLQVWAKLSLKVTSKMSFSRARTKSLSLCVQSEWFDDHEVLQLTGSRSVCANNFVKSSMLDERISPYFVAVFIVNCLSRSFRLIESLHYIPYFK